MLLSWANSSRKRYPFSVVTYLPSLCVTKPFNIKSFRCLFIWAWLRLALYIILVLAFCRSQKNRISAIISSRPLLAPELFQPLSRLGLINLVLFSCLRNTVWAWVLSRVALKTSLVKMNPLWKGFIAIQVHKWMWLCSNNNNNDKKGSSHSLIEDREKSKAREQAYTRN